MIPVGSLHLCEGKGIHDRRARSRSAFVGHTRSTGVGVVASDAFATEGTPPPEAVRVCLGGPADRPAVRGALEFMAHALADSPALASTFL